MTVVTYLTAKREVDPYSGQPVGLDWDEPTRTEAPEAFVLNSSSSNTNDGQSTTTEIAWMLFIPTGEVEPKPGDRVEFDGTVFAMNGRPLRQRNPFTDWAPYAQVQLTMQGGA